MGHGLYDALEYFNCSIIIVIVQLCQPELLIKVTGYPLNIFVCAKS